jgi:asparagine synthetase B (glutamine-hydrolysing)
MCGIGGVRRFGPEPITADQIKTLLIANERRGNDASGVALQDLDGHIHVMKKNVPAWNFVTSTEYEGFIDANLKEDTVIALIHTRAATKGNPSDPRNNHPLWNGKSAVVHNGVLHNDDSLFSRLKLERVGDVDSDVLRAIIDKVGLVPNVIKELNEISGSCAIAAIDSRFPGKLLLGRSGSPLVFASTPDQLVFASEKTAIHHAMRPMEIRHGFPMCPNRTDLAWMTVADDSMYLLGDWHLEEVGEGNSLYRYQSSIEARGKFKTVYNYTAPRYNIHDSFHPRKMISERGKAVDFAWCETCNEWVMIGDALKMRPIYTLICEKCKKFLSPPPSNVKVKRRKIDIITEAALVS